MSIPASVRLGWEDLGERSAFSIFADRKNPFDNTGNCRGPRARLLAMAQIGMASDRCELCGSKDGLRGITIDSGGPESPDNFLALCEPCARSWPPRRVC